MKLVSKYKSLDFLLDFLVDADPRNEFLLGVPIDPIGVCSSTTMLKVFSGRILSLIDDI